MVEPIAVIGLEAKLPCDGDTPEQFYEFLVAGRSSRGPVPPQRYNADSFWHPDNRRDGIVREMPLPSLKTIALIVITFVSILRCVFAALILDWRRSRSFYQRECESF